MIITTLLLPEQRGDAFFVFFLFRDDRIDQCRRSQVLSSHQATIWSSSRQQQIDEAIFGQIILCCVSGLSAMCLVCSYIRLGNTAVSYY